MSEADSDQSSGAMRVAIIAAVIAMMTAVLTTSITLAVQTEVSEDEIRATQEQQLRADRLRTITAFAVSVADPPPPEMVYICGMSADEGVCPPPPTKASRRRDRRWNEYEYRSRMAFLEASIYATPEQTELMVTVLRLRNFGPVQVGEQVAELRQLLRRDAQFRQPSLT